MTEQTQRSEDDQIIEIDEHGKVHPEGSLDWMQPPATDAQEWTPEWLRQYLSGYSSFDLQLKAACAAHNAALAAERENLRQLSSRHSEAERELMIERSNAIKAEQQLAAERRNVQLLNSHLQDTKDLVAKCERLEKQLAAERKKLTGIADEWESTYYRCNDQLLSAQAAIAEHNAIAERLRMTTHQQLAAERQRTEDAAADSYAYAQQLLAAQATLAALPRSLGINKSDTSALDKHDAEVRERGRQEGYSEGWQKAVEELTEERKAEGIDWLRNYRHTDQNLSKEG
jgi:hypothetical protein